MIVRTFLVSTRYTQNETLLKLLKWESTLETIDTIQEVLTQLRYVLFYNIAQPRDGSLIVLPCFQIRLGS